MRRLLANLHPPSPPTARESQQLLNVLQTSFKSRLDEKHPAPSHHDFWPKIVDGDDIPIQTSSTSSHATNSYMSSILASPVIGALDGRPANETAISRFEKLVAEPELDHARLAGLLHRYNRERRTGQRLDAESLSDRLNSWIHITDRRTRENFLLSLSTRTAALDLFHRESRETILWTWLRLVYERQLVQAPLSSVEWLEVEDQLVSRIMRLSIRKHGVSDAARQFFAACRYRVESGRGDPIRHISSSPSEDPSRPLISSGKRLASAILFHRHKHGIEPILFQEILQYLPSVSVSTILSSAFCAIYNPDKPSAADLYAMLKHSYFSSVFSNDLEKSTSRKVVMIAMLDAAKVALDQGKSKQASFILDSAIERFPEVLPARRMEEPEPEIERYLHLIPG